jgi:iron complex transport system permease protein
VSGETVKPPTVDFGRPVLVLRTRGGAASIRLDRRVLVVVTGVAIALVVITAATLAVGTYQLSLLEVWNALFGKTDRRTQLIVLEWRLPRLLFAICCGIALAISGAIFQSITRNPLGSPDVIGFDAGAYTGALIVMLGLGSGSYLGIAAGSVIGGLATAAVVYLLAYRRGVEGFRLIIVGIGVGALLSSFNTYLLLIVDVNEAIVASSWGAGSLNALGFGQFTPFVILLAVLLPFVASIAPGLAQGELGDDAARALGSRVERTRLFGTIVAVALTALVTAAAGPISFIALVAPQIAKRLTGGGGLQLVTSAAVGAVLLAAADFVAQRISLPVGLVTVSVGGIYLIWLLIREYRRS